jgi:hypothetical protein
MLLNTDLCLENERVFFENVLSEQREGQDLGYQFEQHIVEIETKYHKSSQGQFARLWPELEKLV